jgi:hypothetical protein
MNSDRCTVLLYGVEHMNRSVPLTRRTERTVVRLKPPVGNTASDEGKAASGNRFDAVWELENLVNELGRLEALTWAANERLDDLPYAANEKDRQALRRIHHLVTLVAEESAHVLDQAQNAAHRANEGRSALD